jgi:hypothetical protein
LGEYEGEINVGETLNVEESNKFLKQKWHERQGKLKRKQITIQQIQLSWT